jgi:hypothetical protein
MEDYWPNRDPALCRYAWTEGNFFLNGDLKNGKITNSRDEID